MRRAITLICVLTALLLGAGLWVDTAQTACAERYLRAARGLRAQTLAGELDSAFEEQRYVQALWEHDEGWLNLVISHQHTRAVRTALIQLGTALDESERFEALQALDALDDALTDVAEGDAAAWGNIL